MTVVFGNRGGLYRLGHCFPHCFRHPQRTPETQLLYTGIMLTFPRHDIFITVMIFVFLFSFSKTPGHLLLVSCSLDHSVTLGKDFLWTGHLLFFCYGKKLGIIELLVFEKAHIEDLSKLNFQVFFFFFPEISVIVQSGTVL